MTREEHMARDTQSRHREGVSWNTVLVTAHVETARGPCLHMMRAAAIDGSTYEVAARGELEDNLAGSMVFISDQELVFNLRSPIEHEADATMAVDFELVEDTRIELTMVGGGSGPPMVVRGVEDEVVFVLDGTPGEIILGPGAWNLQGTAVPDDRERLGFIRFTSVRAPGPEPVARLP